MHDHFPEDAIYRVDHWLGLDPLNDVLVARFANSMIEPLLIVGMGVLVGFIAISVMSPIFKLVSSIH